MSPELVAFYTLIFNESHLRAVQTHSPSTPACSPVISHPRLGICRALGMCWGKEATDTTANCNEQRGDLDPKATAHCTVAGAARAPAGVCIPSLCRLLCPGVTPAPGQLCESALQHDSRGGLWLCR